MADAKRMEDWNHTASLLAILANAHRDPKKTRPAKPAEFHPYMKRTTPTAASPKADITVLKAVFVDRFPKR
jgi:hypothetical protein